MNDSQTIFVVEDDDEVREAIELFLESRDFRVEGYPSAQAYLDSFDPERTGCLLLDVRMPGMGGLDLQNRLIAEASHPPIIIITGHGDIPMAVRALNAGAVDFIEKPFNDKQLLESISKALEIDTAQRDKVKQLKRIRQQLETLTRREREILDMIIEGKRNKVIAYDLGIALSTVESHRAHLMEKMKADNLSDLMRMMFAVQDL